jgi:hypothetical protein
MKYVFYAFAAVALIAAWLNMTPDGQRAKRHFLAAGTENLRMSGDN